MFSAGTHTPAKYSSAVSWPCWPIFWRLRPRVKPCMPRSTTSRLIPRWRSSGSVLAATITRSALMPLVMKVLAEHYVVDGAKTFITNGIKADLVIGAAKTDPDERHRGISLLVVERGMHGFTRGRNLQKIGQHGQDTAELYFAGVCVPAENILGEENEGFRYLVSNLPQERLSIAASAVAAAEAALSWTLEYVRDRRAFGQPIGSFQSSRFTLAEA